jgi:hypothetical protein
MQAIDDDPNNPAGFLAAAWASLGVNEVKQARDFFREAAQASDGDQRQSSLRQAARLTFLLDAPQAALKELGDSPEQLSPSEEGATDFDRAVYFSKAGEATAAAECIRKASYHDGRFCLMTLTDPILSRDATVVEAAAEQLRAIKEQMADPTAAEVRRAHARYEALCKEIEDLGLAEAVWKWRERRDKWWQDILQVDVPKLAYRGLNALPRAQTFARDVHAAVDGDERALAGRRTELVLNEYLAREVAKGWMVKGRWKLHALIAKHQGAWSHFLWGGGPKGEEVRLDPSGKVISTKVPCRVEAYVGLHFQTSVGDKLVNSYLLDSSEYGPCEYCWSDKETTDRCEDCNGAAGELELFP